MNKNLVFLVSALFFGAIGSVASQDSTKQKDVCLKMAGSYFINCQRTIVFGEQAIMTIIGDDIKGRRVNFDIYSSKGTLDASLQEGVFAGNQASAYRIEVTDTGYSITDTRNKRIVLKVLLNENQAKKRQELHVWADFFLPDGNKFQCSPDDSNVAVLQMMKGSTFENGYTGVQLD